MQFITAQKVYDKQKDKIDKRVYTYRVIASPPMPNHAVFEVYSLSRLIIVKLTHSAN